jgi:DNA-binding NtrC family response regulator
MDSRGASVLLVGQNARSSLQLLQWLDNHGCRCHFASSCKDACVLISQTAFNLVISQFELPDPLLDRLIG